MGDLSRNFSRSEFACKCGCGFDTVDAELVNMLEQVREHFGQPITITSGCRCPDHNDTVGGKASQHLKGRAADFKVKATSAQVVQDYCDEAFPDGGVGRYSTWTHIDSRGVKARW